MTKNELKILEDAVKELQDKQHECFREMVYMKEHKFEMERSAINYMWKLCLRRITSKLTGSSDIHCSTFIVLPSIVSKFSNE